MTSSSQTAVRPLKKSRIPPSVFVNDLVTEMVGRGVLDETLNQNFNRRSRSDPFMQVLVKKVVYDPDFLAPVAALARQHVNKAVKNEPK